MRARLIKPGFFLNEDLAACSVIARLTFAGLWTIADREGRLEDRPLRIKAALMPYDQIDMDNILDELSGHGFILRYSAPNIDESKYIQILNFLKHQQPHHKEIGSVIPPPPGAPQHTRAADEVSAATREAVFERDGRKCLKCGTTSNLSIDHIQPLSKNGGNEISNLQTLCMRCNSSKNDETISYINPNTQQPIANIDSSMANIDSSKDKKSASCPSCSLALTLNPLTLTGRKKVAAAPVVVPDWLDLNVWEEFKTHRKAMRAPMTQNAERLILKTLSDLRTLGHDPKECLERSIANGWRGVFAPNAQGSSARKLSAVEIVMEANRGR